MRRHRETMLRPHGYSGATQDGHMQIECEFLWRGATRHYRDRVPETVRVASRQCRVLLQIESDPSLNTNWWDGRRLAEPRLDDFADIDAGFEARSQQGRAADLALHEQDVCRRQMPGAGVGRNLHTPTAQRLYEAAIAEVEQTRAIEFAQDHVDDLVYGRAVARDNGRSQETGCDGSVPDRHAVARQASTQQAPIALCGFGRDRPRRPEIE